MTRFAIASAVLGVSTLALCLGSQTASAQNPSPAENKNKDFILEKLSKNKAHVEKSVRDALLKVGLPDPLVTDSQDWGKQEEHTVIVFGKRGKPMLTNQLVNSGFWRRMTVRSQDKDSLDITIIDVKKKDGEISKYVLTSEVGVDCVIELEAQDWLRGVKVIGGKAEATCRARLTIECEITLLPVFKLPPTIKVTSPKVTDTKLTYENLKPKKLGPVPFIGRPGEYFADKLVAAVKKVKPSLESELLDKANAATREKVKPLVVKAIDNVEFSDPPVKKSEAKKN